MKGDQIIERLSKYLFSRLDFYNSFEFAELFIDDQLRLARFTFIDEYIRKRVEVESFLKNTNNRRILFRTTRDQCQNLFPYQIANNQYEIQLKYFADLLANVFDGEEKLMIDEEFGSKRDGILYKVNRRLNRNASVIVFEIQNNFVVSSSEMAELELINSAFDIDLGKIGTSNPILAFIFKKSYLSISTSQIFEKNGGECLRVFFDIDTYLRDIEHLKNIVFFRFELKNANKETFYNETIPLSTFVSDKKFIPPYLEIIPATSDQIFSSSISIYINNILHDKKEGSYLRNIKLNIDLKSS